MALDGLNENWRQIFEHLDVVEKGCGPFFSELRSAGGCELQNIGPDTLNKPRITKSTLATYVKKLNNICLTRSNILQNLRSVSESLVRKILSVATGKLSVEVSYDGSSAISYTSAK